MTPSIYPTDSQLILADAHVHIYDCFDLDQFLDAAYENFKRSAAQQGHQNKFTAALLLTETSHDHYFNTLQQAAQGQASPLTQRWQFKQTQEAGALYAYTADQQEMWIIAGRQIITAEDLEVLALASDQTFEDGHPIETVIRDVLAGGGIPVIPWGFGKWLGRRGQIVNRLLDQREFPVLFLGDNSGRPVFWKRPPYFQQAEQQGLLVLPGTDPLPFASEVSRPGQFGFAIPGALNSDTPITSLKQALLAPEAKLKTYGSLENPFRFFRNQLAMQIVKRKRKTA